MEITAGPHPLLPGTWPRASSEEPLGTEGGTKRAMERLRAWRSLPYKLSPSPLYFTLQGVPHPRYHTNTGLGNSTPNHQLGQPGTPGSSNTQH